MLPNLDDLMKEAQGLQGKMEALNKQLAAMRIKGEAGEGKVSVTVNGLQEVLEVIITQEAVDAYTRMQLQDVVKDATNEALRWSQARAAAEMERVTGPLNPAALLKKLSGQR